MKWKLLELNTKDRHESWSFLLEFLYSIMPQNSLSLPTLPCCPPCLCALKYCPKLNFYHRCHLLHEAFSDLLLFVISVFRPITLGVTYYDIYTLPQLSYLFFVKTLSCNPHPHWNPWLQLLYLADMWLVSNIYELNTEKKIPNTQLLSICTLIWRAFGKNKIGIWG